jgi:hypothetical protein
MFALFFLVLMFWCLQPMLRGKKKDHWIAVSIMLVGGLIIALLRRSAKGSPWAVSRKMLPDDMRGR